jgi:hypothetical protein
MKADNLERCISFSRKVATEAKSFPQQRPYLSLCSLWALSIQGVFVLP